MNWRKPVILGLLKFTGSGIPETLELIKSMEYRNKEEIKAIQQDKLKKLLLHAHKNVPYYNKILQKSCAVIDNKVNLENFSKIPILTKDIIRENFEDLKSKDLDKRKWYINTSGGSTGVPVKFVQDKEYWDKNIVNKIYYALRSDKNLGEKEIKIWGSEKDFLEGTIGFKANAMNFLYNRLFLNSFDLSEKNIKLIIYNINSFKPKLIWGYVDSLLILSEYIIDNNIHLQKPEIIFSAAGTLNNDIRIKIQKAFGGRVINIYGSREMGDMAFECRRGVLHILNHSHYLEVIKENKTDEFGKIIVTSLNNYSMPMIRYDIGDLSSGFLDGECSCGLGFTMLKDIVGRETSIFITKGGKKVPPEYFIHMIGVVYNNGFIKKFQVIQKDYELINLKIILNGQKDLERLEDIIKSIKLIMGEFCKVDIDFVDEIKPEKSGKFLYTKSLVVKNES